MRVFTFVSSMIMAGVIATSGSAQDLAGQAGDALSDTAENAADGPTGEAETTGDRLQDAGESARQGVNQRRDGVRNDAQQRAREGVEDDRRFNGQAEARVDGGVNANRDASRGRVGVNAEARANASRNFSDADRNADWRFVQRNGAWWYRTPLNTWMVQRDGRWVDYRGDQYGDARYQDRQWAERGYDNNAQGYPESQAQYQDDQYREPQGQSRENRAYDDREAPRYGKNHPSVGTQEWMCIDGRRRLVTVVSVTPVDPMPRNQPQQARDRRPVPESAERGDRYTAARAMTPPPAPSPDRQFDRDQQQNLPPAPSRDAILQSNGQDAVGQNAAPPQEPSVNDRTNAEAQSEPGASADDSVDPNINAQAPEDESADESIDASSNDQAQTSDEMNAERDQSNPEQE